MPFAGEISALLTAVFWSATSFAFTFASRQVGSLQININRMILASVMLFLIVLLGGINYSVSEQQLSYLVLSGIAGLVLGDSFLFKAFQLIGARISMVLMSLVPAISTLLAFLFLGELISLTGAAGIVITVTGVLIVVTERKKANQAVEDINIRGIIYGILGAAGQASGLILAKFAFAESSLNGFTASFIRLSASSVIIFTGAVILRRYKNPLFLFRQNRQALKAMLAGTLFGPVLGITLSLIAIANTKVGIASTLMALVPVIMLPMVRYHYKQKLSRRAVTGAIIAVAGTAIIFLR
ncbi:MAG: DMT family transporter [Ignavibacteriaceae bacterium]